MSFFLSGGVEVLGFISPTEPTDEYPVIDPLYGIDGLRNVNTLLDLNNIPSLRRRAGMLVGVSGGTQYYKLKNSPWNGTQSDWELFSLGSTFEGGIVTGNTIFTQGVTATTFSASTYLGLPLDVYVTGGTYSNGSLSLRNNDGQTFLVNGFYTGGTDITITGGSYSDGTLTLVNNTGGTITITGFTTGGTGGSSIIITGGTYNNGTLTLVNNTGGTIDVTGFYTGETSYVNSITTGSGLSGNSTTGNVTIVNTSPDLTVTLSGGTGILTGGTYPNFTITNTLPDINVTLTGGTNIEVTGSYPNFGVNYTGQTEFPYLPLSGGTITGDATIDGILTINGELISDNFSGTTNYIPKFTPNSYSIGNSIITNNSNNVSIGTISTPYRFYVLGNNTTAGQPLFVVRDTGRIGIRTTSPLAELSIENSNPTLSQDIITLRNNGSGIGTGNSIRFINSTNLNSTVGSKIESTITNLSGRNTLKFFVHGGGGIFGGLQERMSLDGTGSLFVNNLNANVISGNTYLNLPVTTDTFVTGFSYNNANTFTVSNNDGTNYPATFDMVTGLTVNGDLVVTGTTLVNTLTGTTAVLSGSGQNVLTIIGSGSTQPIVSVQGSFGELFTIYDNLIGSLFSVNDISGLPVLEVFSDNTILMGSFVAPSLNTSTRVIAGVGTTNIYSIPTSAYTGAFFDYTVSDGTNLRAGNIMSIWSGSSVNFSETSTTDFGSTTGLTFNMVVSSGNAVLQTSGVTGSWTVKTIVRSI